jgi:hypothetical protein
VPRSKNAWNLLPPQYTFMAWCSVKKSTGTTSYLPFKVHYRIQKGPPLNPTPNQLNPVHIFSKSQITCPFSKESVLCNVSKHTNFHGGGLAALRPTPKAKIHSLSTLRDCLFKYSQLSSISGGCFLQPQPEDAPCRVTMNPFNDVTRNKY